MDRPAGGARGRTVRPCPATSGPGAPRPPSYSGPRPARPRRTPPFPRDSPREPAGRGAPERCQGRRRRPRRSPGHHRVEQTWLHRGDRRADRRPAGGHSRTVTGEESIGIPCLFIGARSSGRMGHARVPFPLGHDRDRRLCIGRGRQADSRGALDARLQRAVEPSLGIRRRGSGIHGCGRQRRYDHRRPRRRTEVPGAASAKPCDELGPPASAASTEFCAGAGAGAAAAGDAAVPQEGGSNPRTDILAAIRNWKPGSGSPSMMASGDDRLGRRPSAIDRSMTPESSAEVLMPLTAAGLLTVRQAPDLFPMPAGTAIERGSLAWSDA